MPSKIYRLCGDSSKTIPAREPSGAVREAGGTFAGGRHASTIGFSTAHCASLSTTVPSRKTAQRHSGRFRSGARGFQPKRSSKLHTYYGDILDRIPGEPLWWDENAVPRYCEFSPGYLANIYASEAVLLLISCQIGAHHHFHVAMSRQLPAEVDLATEIQEKRIHYGDPPVVAYCSSPDANSVAIQVLQYWRREASVPFRWVRDPALEIDVLEAGWEDFRNPAPRTSKRM